MDFDDQLEELQNGAYGLSKKAASLSEYTSFHIGGRCRLLLEPTSQKEAIRAIRYLRAEGIPFYLMGKGTNLLVQDDNLDQVIIRLADKDADIAIEGDKIYCEAGAPLTRVAKLSFRSSLTGMEDISGIPGSVGGACIMNASAYDGSISDIIEEVTVLDREGDIRTLSHDEMGLGYRTSRMQEEGMVVLSAVFQLKKGSKEAILSRYKEVTDRRTSKQPLDKYSAGSTFKRPKGGYASQLIDEAGLRGFRMGGARVSPKHCGFVINEGGASFKDVEDIIHHIQKTVYEHSGIQLEPEVRILDGNTIF